MIYLLLGFMSLLCDTRNCITILAIKIVYYQIHITTNKFSYVIVRTNWLLLYVRGFSGPAGGYRDVINIHRFINKHTIRIDILHIKCTCPNNTNQLANHRKPILIAIFISIYSIPYHLKYSPQMDENFYSELFYDYFVFQTSAVNNILYVQWSILYRKKPRKNLLRFW